MRSVSTSRTPCTRRASGYGAAEEHAALVGELRKAADAAGVHVVINARTDLFLRNDGDDADRVERAVARLKLAADAGADSLYPVGRHDPETTKRLTAELPLPVNAIALPDQDDPASFGPLGVGRISFGPFLQRALSARAEEILAAGADEFPGRSAARFTIPPVADDDGRPDWHDQRGLIWAAGVAAVALICLLVYAVIRVSSGSSFLPGGLPSATSFSDTPSTTRNDHLDDVPATRCPSVQTSEDTGPPVTVPPTADDPGSDDTTTTTSTTIYNPYGTTTPTNAGHI